MRAALCILGVVLGLLPPAAFLWAQPAPKPSEARWEKFELEAALFLNQAAGSDRVRFLRQGGADSTATDVEAQIDGKTALRLEAKLAPSQCGQFVALPQDGKFLYSPKNKTPLNAAAKEMLAHMDARAEEFQKASTAGCALQLPQAVYARWIRSHYEGRGVKYMATNATDGGIAIVSLAELEACFNITATYRVKRSGSRPVKQLTAEMESAMQKHFPGCLLETDGKQAVVKQAPDKLAEAQRHAPGGLYLSPTDLPGVYFLKKLSATANANVIFSIEPKAGANPTGLKSLQEELAGLLKQP